MATQAQLDEKLRQDRLGLDPTPEPAAQQEQSNSSASLFATPAQLAEKASSFATPAQLAEKSSFATPEQLAEKSQRRPPPLPPRESSASSLPPPAYSRDDERRNDLISQQWKSNDPRSSSTTSLVPSESQRDGRRKLLLIYIHGFMGTELSFQSFPAHCHNLLTIALVETHVVHTKIYPRYKSRNSIQSARDDFSNWLEPHEDSKTDIVLLGHSMGGMLAAEVVLQQQTPFPRGKPLKHRILGMIGFDTPFLGMHPGVVVSGIGSLFRPAPEPPSAMHSQAASNSGMSTPLESQASRSPKYAASTVGSIESSQPSLVQSITSPLASPPINDPYYDAPFNNDVNIPERKGWNSLLHFVNKHSDGLVDATKSYFMSHIEFGSVMADYPGMKVRYEKVRALEDVKDTVGSANQAPTRKVRFLNYYTASSGRPKVPKAPKESSPAIAVASTEEEAMDGGESIPMPTLTLSEHEDGVTTPRQLDEAPTVTLIGQEMQHLGDSSGVEDAEDELFHDAEDKSSEIQHFGDDSDLYDADDGPPGMRHIDSVPMDEPSTMQHVDSIPILDDEEEQVLRPTQSVKSSGSSHSLQQAKSEPALPPLPEIPIEPEAIDLDKYTDKDERKIAEKEQKRVMKVYQQAVKDRESAVKDRKKLIEKREKKAKQDSEKQAKADEKQRLKDEKEAAKKQQLDEKEAAKKQQLEEKEASKKQQLEEKAAAEKGKGKAIAEPAEDRSRQGSVAPSVKDEKPKRDKKFCMLPPTVRGKVDKCWVRIYMEGVDEVGAHCGLFFPGPQYESLVGDLGARIEGWVMDAAAAREAEGRGA